MSYASQWQVLVKSWQQKKLAQGLLFVGAFDKKLQEFIHQWLTLLVCKSATQEACKHCNDCLMMQAQEHPDVLWIKPEKSGSPIKIDQIRSLQHNAYLSPQRALQRVIVIEGAERMNVASQNALLKVLEEPASHTLFLLLAQQISTVLPTILSRCQIHRFSSDFMPNLLQLDSLYAEGSEQAKIAKEAQSIVETLIALRQQNAQAFKVAAQWQKLDLSALLWFLYWALAKVQMEKAHPTEPAGTLWTELASLVRPIPLFAVLKEINQLQNKLANNLQMNTLLALESLLLAFSEQEGTSC